jgi:hypothetical protein
VALRRREARGDGKRPWRGERASLLVRETLLDEAGRVSARRPRRAVSTKSVNTL